MQAAFPLWAGKPCAARKALLFPAAVVYWGVRKRNRQERASPCRNSTMCCSPATLTTRSSTPSPRSTTAPTSRPCVRATARRWTTSSKTAACSPSPPILYMQYRIPVSSQSKAPWGLSVLAQVTSIFTGISISPGALSRQCPNHYAFRAGRNLPDKEFRYLRTVIVTAAVYWGLNSMLRLL